MISRPFPRLLRNLILLLALGLAVAARPATAGYSEGLAAYRKGEVATAMKELLPPAQAGNAAAQVLLAQILINGGKGVPKNPPEGMTWVRRAAGGGNRDAQVFLGQALYNGNFGQQKDVVESAKWFRLAADAGDERAMLTFAQMLLNGVGSARDPAAAVPYLEKLAATGEVRAHAMLGSMAAQGQGMPQDHARAGRHLAAATRQGDAGSALVLGQLTAKGLGVEKNVGEGVRLVRLAADAGNYHAMMTLAVLLANGEDDIALDEREAYKWLTIVLNRAPQGDIFYSASGLETQLRGRLSRRQIEAAQAEASRFAVKPIEPSAIAR